MNRKDAFQGRELNQTSAWLVSFNIYSLGFMYINIYIHQNQGFGSYM